jgi:hypothetical protein
VQWSGDSIRTIGSAVTILTGVVGLVWFASSLNSRISRLEEQIHLLTVAPTIASATTGTVTPNPIAQACADLAREAGTSIVGGHELTEGRPLQDMMNKLGCSPDAKSSQQK